MRIIDVHAHVYPPKIEAKAVNAIREFYDRPYMAHKGSPEALLESGRARVLQIIWCFQPQRCLTRLRV